MKPKVYVVQKQLRLDKGELVPKFDLSQAAKHGELVYLLSPTCGPFNSEEVIDELEKKLANFSSSDFLLLVGNPCLIGWACTIAAAYAGNTLQFLQWSSRVEQYVCIRSKLFAKEPV